MESTRGHCSAQSLAGELSVHHQPLSPSRPILSVSSRLEVVHPYLNPAPLKGWPRSAGLGVLRYPSALAFCSHPLPSQAVTCSRPRLLKLGFKEPGYNGAASRSPPGAEDRRVLGGPLLQPCGCPPDITSTCAVPLMSVPKLEPGALF